MRGIIFFLIICLCPELLRAKIINVGSAYPVKTITSAFQVANPGDTLLCHDEIIAGGMSIANKHGNHNAWFYLLAASQNVTLSGGGNSIQFSDCSYIHVEGFTIQGQSGNGMNIDDAGSFNTPAHHFRIKKCQFKMLGATGNNDQLKLSGLDSFFVEKCSFDNGATGGSGIDMVGCHLGTITQCTFTNMGSNAIQAKGGSAYLSITRNKFTNAGARALNLGGSTGLEFFRPQDATSEAHDITVIANLIIGSEAAAAFVGCRKVSFSNNTIIHPDKWVLRILQETVDPSRFLPCGDNSFFNNIILIDNKVSVIANIGLNTDANSFSFSNNVWYKTTQATWTLPQLPGSVSQNQVINPLLLNDYKLSTNSPAIGKGIPYTAITYDFYGSTFALAPSLGFHEGGIMSATNDVKIDEILVYPNPCSGYINASLLNVGSSYALFNADGRLLLKGSASDHSISIDTSTFKNGLYFLVFENNKKTLVKKFVKM